MERSEYHSHEALGSGDVKNLIKHPVIFYYERNRTDRSETPSMRLGTLVHECWLEPEKFTARTIIDNLRLKASREKAQETERNGNGWVSTEEHKIIQKIQSSLEVLQDRLDWQAFGKTEVPVIAKCPLTDTPIKALLDGFNPGFPMNQVVDLKTTKEWLDDESLARVVKNYGYDVQEAHYRNVLQASDLGAIDQFIFVFVQTVPPYACRAIQLPHAMVDAASRRCFEAYRRWQLIKADPWIAENACLNGKTPDLLALPGWMQKQIENEIDFD